MYILIAGHGCNALQRAPCSHPSHGSSMCRYLPFFPGEGRQRSPRVKVTKMTWRINKDSGKAGYFPWELHSPSHIQIWENFRSRLFFNKMKVHLTNVVKLDYYCYYIIKLLIWNQCQSSLKMSYILTFSLSFNQYYCTMFTVYILSELLSLLDCRIFIFISLSIKLLCDLLYILLNFCNIIAENYITINITIWNNTEYI